MTSLDFHFRAWERWTGRVTDVTASVHRSARFWKGNLHETIFLLSHHPHTSGGDMGIRNFFSNLKKKHKPQLSRRNSDPERSEVGGEGAEPKKLRQWSNPRARSAVSPPREGLYGM